MAGHQHAIAVRGLFLAIVLAIHDRNEDENTGPRSRRTLYQSRVNANRHKSHFFHLIQELWLASATDTSYLRMTMGQFESLAKKIGPIITHKSTHRLPISTGERLAMTLRFLASGDQITSVATNFRIGKSTAHYVLKETCNAIWQSLSNEVLKFPSSKEEWKAIANGFATRWNFPNCMGAIDGKHVTVQAPPMSGSKYFNYKSTHSLVLMAACDSSYCFTFVDLGAPGRQSDGRVFAASALGQLINHPTDTFPDPEPLEDGGIPHPFVFVADEAFPLKDNLMRPFPGRHLTERQKILNYRLSRARRVIENCFGIFCQRWQLFRCPIVGHQESVESYLKAAIILHNWLRKDDASLNPRSRAYCPPGYADWIDRSGRIKDGKWRADAENAPSANLQPAPRMGSNNHTMEASHLRNSFMNYFATNGAVPWQLHHVRYGS